MKRGMVLAGLCLLAALAWSAPVKGEDYARQRVQMVAGQIQARGVRDPRVLAAMRKVPRHLFVPPAQRKLAYSDQPLPIGLGQTISQPVIVAYMTELLKLKKGEKVLEIGTGSGYQAAVLAEMGGRVFSIEILPELSRRAAKVLKRLGYKNIRLRVGDGYQGWPGEAPFGAIIVTAAPPEVPRELLRQLKKGGRMVVPVGPAFGVQKLMLIERGSDGGLRQRAVELVRFVPMVRGKRK